MSNCLTDWERNRLSGIRQLYANGVDLIGRMLATDNSDEIQIIADELAEAHDAATEAIAEFNGDIDLFGDDDDEEGDGHE